MKVRIAVVAMLLSGMLVAVSCNKQEGPVREAVSHKDDYQQAYIYGFPMIAGYKAMYQFAIDKSNSQFKAPFNVIWNDSKTFTPKDTATRSTARSSRSTAPARPAITSRKKS